MRKPIQALTFSVPLALNEITSYIKDGFFGDKVVNTWQSEEFTYPNEKLPQSGTVMFCSRSFYDLINRQIYGIPNYCNIDIKDLYDKICKQRLLLKLAEKSKDFVSVINVYENNKQTSKIRIFDQTVLEDLLSGQTFLPSEHKFVIYCPDKDYFFLCLEISLIESRLSNLREGFDVEYRIQREKERYSLKFAKELTNSIIIM